MILVNKKLSPEALLRFFENNFSEKDWFYIDMYSDDENSMHPKPNGMGFYLVTDFSNAYPLEIVLTETNEAVVKYYQQKIAKVLSETLRLKIVIDFVHPEKPDDPYYSLLYDQGNCFLVDDSEWEQKEAFIILGPWP